MIQNVLVEFIHEIHQTYDPDSGEYTKSTEIKNRYCNVTQLSAKRSIELFGEYVEGTLIVRSTSPFNFKFEKLKIGSTTYVVSNRLHTLNRTSLVVKKVSDYDQ